MKLPNRVATSVAGILAITAVSLGVDGASAVETRFWHVDSHGTFEEGEFDGLSLDADGLVTLAPARDLVVESSEVYFWEAVAGSRGRILVGTGDNGLILQVAGARHEELADLEILEVMALAVGDDGTVFAGGTPGGKVYAVSPQGEVNVYYDAEQGVIWDLAITAQGELLIATGDEGRVIQVRAPGDGRVIYASTDPHVMCLYPLPSGAVLAGTAGDGLVSRIEPDGTVRILYDAAEEEVRSIAVTDDETIYIAVNLDPAAHEGNGGAPIVYRLGGWGSAQSVWKTSSAFLFDLETGKSGELYATTGDPAALYRIDPRLRRATRVAEFEETNLLTVVPQSDRVVVGTSDPARLYALGTHYGDQGTVESSVRDAGAEAQWSRVRSVGRTPGGTQVSFETRTGNRRSPDDTWSAWETAEAERDGSFRVTSRAARFFQWRMSLQGAGSSSPSVTGVITSYREINLPPEIAAIEVSRKGGEIYSSMDARPRSVRRQMVGGVEIDYTLPSDHGSSEPLPLGEAQWARSLRSVTWLATDPNGDELSFDLFYQPVGSDRWLVLGKDLSEVIHTWDASAFPDGDYRIKLVATDEKGNPGGGGLEDERMSGIFEVDNTAPEISGLKAVLTDGQLTIQVRARDDRSAIVRADVTFDGREWRPVRSSGRLLDARSVDLDHQIEAGEHGRGDPLVIRFFDEAGNLAVSRTFIE